jgi:hypothetical protein
MRGSNASVRTWPDRPSACGLAPGRVGVALPRKTFLVPDNSACKSSTAEMQKAPPSMSWRGLAAEAPDPRPISRGTRARCRSRCSPHVSVASATSFSLPRTSHSHLPRQHSGPFKTSPRGCLVVWLVFLVRPAPCGAVGYFYSPVSARCKPFGESFLANPDPCFTLSSAVPFRHTRLPERG